MIYKKFITEENLDRLNEKALEISKKYVDEFEFFIEHVLCLSMVSGHIHKYLQDEQPEFYKIIGEPLKRISTGEAFNYKDDDLLLMSGEKE